MRSRKNESSVVAQSGCELLENRKQESEGAEQRAHSKESRFKPSIIP
jgi:hypothetical protein